jgi:hypothetical protein
MASQVNLSALEIAGLAGSDPGTEANEGNEEFGDYRGASWSGESGGSWFRSSRMERYAQIAMMMICGVIRMRTATIRGKKGAAFFSPLTFLRTARRG